ncbi:MAG: beta-ribofuranosylaminobenzene 5'-phosphate synthase [Candidatus Hydrothermarchaeaceae archaeon]
MIIKTPSRIHMTLIDMNASLGRMDGGIGLALKEPCIEISAKKAEGVSATGLLKERAKDASRRTLNALEIEGGIKVNVSNAFSQHVGLGSGTQIALAAGMSVCKLYKKDLPLEELSRIVGRGGTSGIGTYAFQRGGFIIDGGHSLKDKKDFLPSSASKAPLPPVLLRTDFPDWKIALLTPKVKNLFKGSREVGIFQKFCPVPPGEVEKLSRIILMMILPSILEEDIKMFGDGINKIQKIGFKSIEVALQRKEIRVLMDTCRKYSYGVGLSSFGPTIYCIIKDERGLKSAAGELAKITVTKASNRGATIT